MDNVAEKLNIDKEKIIHILLKHLMLQRNEIAYIKNNAGINSEDNGISKMKEGVSYAPDGIEKNEVGVSHVPDGIPKNEVGVNYVPDGIAKNEIGVSYVPDGIAENKVGVKSVFEALPTLNGGANTDTILYTIFEQQLLKALEQYIKIGDGKNSLYSYYKDFEQAVSEKNMEAEKIKAAERSIPLEETHILPDFITIDVASIQKVKIALRGHLPNAVRRDLYKKVAGEILFLHNARKATGNELREFGVLSILGFRKHLTRLKHYDLIKSTPPNSYVLSETSTHILLKIFGIKNNN